LTSGVAAGVAAASYYGSQLFEVTNTSIESLGNQTLASDQTGRSWQIPHLLRRAGFSASPEELASYQDMEFNDAVDSLLNYESFDESNLPKRPNITMSYTRRPSAKEVGNLIWWWVERMVNTPNPLEEKMTLFWHNHFATAIYKVRSPYLMFKQNQLLRSRGMGDFKDLLMGVTEDPAMLIWLDGYRNRKGTPNENYGREVMEVFTLGRGNYTEDDVHAAASALTGYTLDKTANTHFNTNFHDTSQKTFLGQTGNFDPEDIVHILANHSATAQKLATELFQYFAYTNPSSDIVNSLAQVYTNSGRNIKAVVEAILKSDDFVSQQAYLAQVKSPVEFVVDSLRSLGANVKPSAAIRALNNMGQLPFNPPDVFGWPSGLAWVNTSTVLQRINFPLQLHTSTQNGDSIDSIPRILFPEGLPEEVTQAIQNSTAAFTTAEDRERNILRLTMASPFYNLN
jgi:uncharacterized protein (DUF1800 family)